MPVLVENLWSLARRGQRIDAARLAGAMEREAAEHDLDFRTRLLIRDGLDALEGHWGQERFVAWLAVSPAREAMERIRGSDLGEVGFPSLRRRIMDATDPETVLLFLRELGLHLSTPTRLEIGGAIALILTNTLSRNTDDIDVVDEVPADLRAQHELLHELADRYGLHLTHFQSHYLPSSHPDCSSGCHVAGAAG